MCTQRLKREEITTHWMYARLVNESQNLVKSSRLRSWESWLSSTRWKQTGRLLLLTSMTP